MKSRILYFGDNLHVLREKFPSDEGYFDLVYLDPPFNSNATYNVLFKEGLVDSEAQVAAFEDTWHWTREAQQLFDELCSDPRYPEAVGALMQGLVQLVGHNDLMAYLTMMTVRLVELHRVLKETGSLYLHCDPTASHYLKIVLDAIFGKEHFRNEIIWKRTSGHSDAVGYGSVHDTILFYTKSDRSTWIETFQPYDPAYVEQYYRYVEEGTGRRFMSGDLGAAGLQGGGYDYEWKGVRRVWRCPIETMQAHDANGKLFYTKNGIPRIKRYLDEAKGMPTQDVWTDVEALRSWHKERMGYPTQKPEALLERILRASTNEGDWVLDPFGGCGTTVAAAEKLRRNWVMIDITTLSINLVKRRIEELYPEKPLEMTVDGLPADAAGAKALFERDPFEFEYWCCDLVNARPAGGKKKGSMKGADRGIDGIITVIDATGKGQQVYQKVLVQVKGGGVQAKDIRDLRGTVEREKAIGGVLLTLQPPSKPMEKEAAEAGSFVYALSRQSYPVIQILTIEQLLHGMRPNLPTQMGYVKEATPTGNDDQGTLFR